MTIGKKLHAAFALILGILLIFFPVNTAAVLKERSTRADTAAALDSVRAIELVRYQIMINRLDLDNFLLSGDPRDEDKVNHGLSEFSDLLKRSEVQATGNDPLRTALIQVESLELNWGDNFAKPLVAKRHQVDSGDATVSDLQIFYLQKDPSSWLAKSSAVLDQTAEDIRKALAESAKFSALATTVGTVVSIFGTLAAILIGFAVAFYTAKSITEPLNHLITVAREIGDSGDLDQNIDIHRTDEIGSLATTFNNMVASERSEEHTSELQSRLHLVCRLLLEKKKKKKKNMYIAPL